MPLTDFVEETIHGTLVRDPYRWLEDRTLPETDDWIRSQQQLCEKYFDSCTGFDFIESRVREYLDVKAIDQPARVRDRYFYRKRSKGQEQGTLCVREVSSGIEHVLIDPAEEGRFVSVGIYRISQDASLLAYEIKRGGEDRKEIHIFDVDRGVHLPDNIPSGYARGFAFARNGFFYAQETESNSLEHTIRYHSFGSALPDRVVFRVPRFDRSRLILTGNAHGLGAVWMRPQGAEIIVDLWITSIEESSKWHEVFSERRVPCGTILYRDRIFAVAENASKGSKLIELSLDGREMRTLIPESDSVLRQIVVAQNRIFVSYLLESGVTTMEIWRTTGERVGAISVPAGTIRIQPVYDENAGSVFYNVESFDTPPTIYEHNVEDNTSRIWHQTKAVDQTSRCNVQKARVTSKDGAAVSLTVASSARIVSATPRPAVMTSYGGFGVALTPQFSVLVAIMMELGAIFVIAHIRGGGEHGKQWHASGCGKNRQATIDDFIAAAEWLCRQDLTSASQIGIFGGSNSGLLVAAAMTQRPDLFGAVVCIAPLLDMVRYESFDQAEKWRDEYGSVADPEEFRALHAYSPYHNVANGTNYPATLFVTGDKDDRCNPAHVRKMAARLQERPAQISPVIVDYSEERGHSPVLPLSVRVEALARRIAFLCRELHIPLASGGLDETTRL